MIKITIYLFSTLILINSVFAETIAYKLNSNLKIEGSASIEIKATPLVDNKIIEKSKDKLVSIMNFANNQSEKIRTKNKNRKPRTKYKGAPEEI